MEYNELAIAGPLDATNTPVAPPINEAPQTFSVDPITPVEKPTFSIDTSIGNSNLPLSSEMSERRAGKFKYGLDEVLNKSKDELRDVLSNGGETDLRQQAASEIDMRKMEQTQKAITEITNRKGGALSEDEANGITKIIADMSLRTDPETVLEEAYSKQFMATLDRTAETTPGSFLTEAKQKFPEDVAKIFEEKSTVLTKREYAQKLSEDVDAEIKEQGTIPYVADQLKGIIPGYGSVKLRGNVGSVNVFAGGSLGNNLEEQRKALLRLPFIDYKIKLKEIVDGLRKDNPSIAKQFVDSVIGMSTDDIAMQSGMEFLDLGTSGYGKLAVGAIKKAAGLGAKETIDLSRKGILDQVVKAADDMQKAAANPDISKSGIHAAAGDLHEAGIVKATSNLVSDNQNIPDATKRAVEALPTTLRSDLTDIRANPGRGGQELVNRIEESSTNLTSNVMNAVENVIKVERIPEVLATETGIRVVADTIKDTYRGIRNSILDISPVYVEKVSNNKLVDLVLGNPDGTYFTSKTVAENFIKVHGIVSGAVEEGTNKGLTKSAVKTAKLEANIKEYEATIESYQNQLKNPNLTPKRRSDLEFQVSEEGLPVGIEKAREELTVLKANTQTATVEQQGLGFYVKVTKPLNETAPGIRNLLAETKNTQIPDSTITKFTNGLLGKFRTPEDVLSLAERQNRNVITSAPSVLIDILKKSTPEIQSLSNRRFTPKGRGRWKDFERVLEAGQDLPDEFGRRGMFFKNPEELESFYQTNIGRLPDQQEVVAYFEFKQAIEVDRMFRNIAVHRNQQRVGAETHKVFGFDDTGRVDAPEFSGVMRRNFPGGTDNVVIMGDKMGEEKVFNIAKMPVKERKAYDDAVKAGQLKVVEIFDPELRPLNGFGDQIGDSRVRYIVSKNVDTRELDWNHIPRRGGGHIQYDYDWYIKQPNIKFDKPSGSYWYEGDTTIAPIQLQSMGENISKHLDEVRKLLKAEDPEAAMAYSNKNLHIEWNTVKGWFTDSVNPDGKFTPARLNLDERIRVVNKNKKIVDVDNELSRKYATSSSDSNFRNGTREGSLARQSEVEFTGERDSFDMITFEDKGSRGNPLYTIAPAKVIDPISSMNRGLTRIVKSNFMDDYKTMTVEHWLKQASKYMSANDSEIWSAPYYHYNNPKFLPGTPPEIRRTLEASKYHTDQITGVPSETGGLLHSMAQKLADSLYENLGPKALVVEPDWILPKLKDPTAALRSMTHSLKMGLFNIPQFVVQMGNYSNILGIAGYKYAAPGTLGAQLHFWSTVNRNPEVIAKMDEWATKVSLPGSSDWKPGQFKEAFELMNRTGWGSVNGEYATLDNPFSNKMVKGLGRTFLDWGDSPFKAGERNAKYGAWYTAYKEFRDKVPVGKLTDDDTRSILQRADLLNLNMTRASSSAIHKGVLSVPTQFYTYQIRLLEAFFSKRLTTQEKARMFGVNALLYGIPTAGGLTGLPIASMVNQLMAGNTDYTTGENVFKSIAMMGLPAALFATITGNGDPQAGTWYDFNDRFGTKGLEFLGGLNKSDKNFMDIAGGPAYGVVKDLWNATDGYRAWYSSIAREDGEHFKLTSGDFVEPLKIASSINIATRTISVLETGKWLSRNEAYLSDATTAEGLTSFFTGLKNQRINDIQTMRAVSTNRAENEKQMEKQFNAEFKRGVLALQDGNSEQADRFFRNAKVFLVLGGYRQDKINTLMSRAAGDNDSILKKMTFDFYIKKSPDAQVDQNSKTYRKILEMEDKRNAK